MSRGEAVPACSPPRLAVTPTPPPPHQPPARPPARQVIDFGSSCYVDKRMCDVDPWTCLGGLMRRHSPRSRKSWLEGGRRCNQPRTCSPALPRPAPPPAGTPTFSPASTAHPRWATLGNVGRWRTQAGRCKAGLLDGGSARAASPSHPAPPAPARLPACRSSWGCPTARPSTCGACKRGGHKGTWAAGRWAGAAAPSTASRPAPSPNLRSGCILAELLTGQPIFPGAPARGGWLFGQGGDRKARPPCHALLLRRTSPTVRPHCLRRCPPCRRGRAGAAGLHH